MIFVVVLLLLLPGCGVSRGADWPTWRHDAQRTGYTAEELPRTLRLQWVRELPEPAACWPATEIRLQFDASYEPIAAGGMVVVPSMVRDSVTAYEAETGEELWRFYADGPVRFAPVYRDGKLFFASDDGCLYCVNASDGSPRWRFRGGPSDYRVLGNERLISAWPARGAPVLDEGRVYFAASIWPFMGTFFYALDAETGKVLWENSGSGSDYVLQPHGSPAFAGVAPQGYLAVAGDVLLVPGGRSVPAGYSRQTGEFLYHRGDTKDGEYAFFVGGEHVFNQGRVARAADGGRAGAIAASVIMGEAAIGVDAEGRLRATSLRPAARERVDRRGKAVREEEFPTLWALEGDRLVGKVFIGAGSRLWVGNDEGMIGAVDAPEGEAAGGERLRAADRISWTAEIEGEPWSMAAADGRLLVVTKGGRIYCFGGEEAKVRRHAAPSSRETGKDAGAAVRAKRILDLTGAREGYGLVLGVGDGSLAEELVRQSDLRLIGFEADARKVAALRRRFDEAGIYGERIALLAGDAVSPAAAPYFASLAVCEDAEAAGYGTRDGFLERVFHTLRPYGGTACFGMRGEAQGGLIEEVRAKGFPGAAVKAEDGMVLLERAGPLPGSAPWTHQYGDIGNTVCSKDRLVKPPLALLWFGGPSNADVLPRHGHGPCEQVIGGRLFIEGISLMSARDVYTGRLLWRKELPELNTLGMYYDHTHNPDPWDRSYNQVHLPGANQYGSNFAATEDRVYVLQEETCLVIDAADGATLAEWRLPEKDGMGTPKWGYVGVYGDRLIAGVAPYEVVKKGDAAEIIPNHRFAVGSKYLAVLDRKTGDVLWEREAEYNFRHNTIAAGDGKVFCIDGMSDYRLDLLRRRGMEFRGKPRILALDIRSGKEAWRAEEGVFGTWLAYSEEYDVVLEGGSRAGDRAGDEAGAGMAAYRGKDGERLWKIDEAYSGPPILHHERIITQTGGANRHSAPGKAFQLLTGERVTAAHPLTGEEIPFGWIRFKGCNTAVAGEHIMTFRSASACYADLATGAGTTSIGGFKSGCTSNLVPADGVLNAPEYTRTCTCSYQNQTSLALVHAGEGAGWPDVEGWSFDWYAGPREAAAVERAGINFGAPGNRFDREGTLWLECPSVGGPSPEIPVFVEPADARLYRFHMSAIERAGEGGREDDRWVAASGIEGVTRVVIRPFLQPGDADGDIQGFERHAGTADLPRPREGIAGSYEVPRKYRVRLVFAETAEVEPGARVFDILVQGEAVREGFDAARAAGGAMRAVSVEIADVRVKDEVRIDFWPAGGGKGLMPILSGIELAAE